MTSSENNRTYACDCHRLDMAAEEPAVPIVFDELSNEYRIEHRDQPGHSRIVYCPFCGDLAPTSRQQRLYARLTSSETERLKELTKDIHTLDDAVTMLGEPDEDLPQGVELKSPEQGEDPPQSVFYRCLIYKKLSKRANVRITDYLSDRVHIAFEGIYTGPAKSADKSLTSAKTVDPAHTPGSSKEIQSCSFCGKTQHEVHKLIAGPTVFICDECVDLCAAIVNTKAT